MVKAMAQDDCCHEPDDAAPQPVEYRRLVTWGWRILGWERGLFLLCLLLNLAVSQLFPLSMKALEALTTTLNGISVEGPMAFLFSDSNGQKEQVMIASLAFAIISIATILCRLAISTVNTYLDPMLESTLQSKLHDQIITLGPKFHECHKAGESMTVMTNYAGYTIQLAKNIYTLPFVEGAGLVTSFYFIEDSLRHTNVDTYWRIALGTLLLTIPMSGYLLSWRLRQAYTLLRKKEFALQNELMSTLDKPVETQLMNAAPQRANDYRHRLHEYYRQFIRAQLINMVNYNLQSGSVLAAQILFVLVTVFSGLLPNDSASLLRLGPNLVVFITLIPRVCEPLQALVAFYLALQTSWSSARPVLNLLEASPEVKERGDAIPLVCRKAPIISLEDLTFGYNRSQPPILCRINHIFTPGKTTAIVGSSGEGKTTLFYLITRIFDPWSGTVLVNGFDIRGLTLASLRDSLAVVSQFPMFLEDTVRKNFQLAKADANDKEIREICERTGLWETLTRVAPGNELDFVVLKNHGLSGGQRRLLALCRGLLRQPKALLLDEPTSSLGADGVREVLDALQLIRSEWPDTTILVVDHGMNFVHQFADEVICLDEGRLIESGNPAELLHHPREMSIYRSLWEDYNNGPRNM